MPVFPRWKEATACSQTGVIKIKPFPNPFGDMLVISAAAVTIRLPYNKEKHGLFTYFLLKKMQATSGDSRMGNYQNTFSKRLFHVPRRIRRTDPSVNFSPEVQDT